MDGFVVAHESGAVIFGTGLFPGAEDSKADAEREKARKDAGIGAQLFQEYPIRLGTTT